MQRALTSVVLVALLGGTAAAFALTEKLKLEKSPVFGTLVTDRFSPVCGCATAAARIRFKLRRRDTLRVTILDGHRRLVDTLAANEPAPAGVNVFQWRGGTDEGARATDGTYYVEIHLAAQHRTLLLPNRIVLDTAAPQVESAEATRPTFSPDGDHQADSVAVRYTLNKPAFVVVSLSGRRIVRGRFHRPEGSFTWAGTFAGRLLPPGTYTLSVGALDLAGNSTPATRRARVLVTLRYITLATHRVRVRPSRTIEIGVSTDARHYSWRLGARHGIAHGPRLAVAAPKRAGRYRLVVVERGHTDAASVIVR